MRLARFITIFTIALTASWTGKAQSETLLENTENGEFVEQIIEQIVENSEDSITFFDPYNFEIDTTLVTLPVPNYYFIPAIYANFVIPPTVDNTFNLDSIRPYNEITGWVDQEVANFTNLNRMRQRYMVSHPDQVRYNMLWMPEPPKKFHAVIDPRTNLITVEAVTINKNEVNDPGLSYDVGRRNWIHGFDGQLQFSQAYISPNWYQGGNNNVNMLLNMGYAVKLNTAFHPNLMFENSINYKLALNSTPEDSIRNYSISEDLLQINSKFGVKAAKRWFYSIALVFKTQIFNGHNINERRLKSAFMSPGELNIGLGMTYNYASPNKNVTFDASVSPLSYNLKTCINNQMDPTVFGIKAGRKFASQYGSSGEAKLMWKVTRNITYSSRLFAFTDYNYLQGDWENTIQFAINRFLSTQIYVHLRYDSSTTPLPDSRWDDWQLKEILSFGFSYKFSML